MMPVMLKSKVTAKEKFPTTNGLPAIITNCRKYSSKRASKSPYNSITIQERVQFNYCNNVKSNLAKNEILIHIDYSESYENKQQQEIQGTYFGHTTFSIFTACRYLRDAEDKVICESVTITSELPDHSRAGAITSVLKVVDHLREKHQHLPLKINTIIWSDGCSAQFWSRFLFKLLAGTDSSLNITWCYNE